MGGVAGHLNHVYDNRDLSFNQIKKILTMASRGELVGTEKTDGYNIYLGYQGGQPRAARNKGDMSRGGMTFKDLVNREFKGGDQVKQVYLSSFRAFSLALNSLSEEEKVAIFGPSGEIFYNTEIQGPGASNVVNYDANVVSIHRSGHKKYVAETNSIEVVDAEQNSKFLDSKIDQFEQVLSNEDFSVRRTAFMSLKKLTDDYDLQIALAKIRKAGLEGTMTIGDLLQSRLTQDFANEYPQYSEGLRQQVVDRVLKNEGHMTLSQIYKGFAKEDKAKISQYVKDSPAKIKRMMWPFEEAIHDFSVSLLEGMESAYILDNSKELHRVINIVSDAINRIKSYDGPGDEEAHSILATQLKKIKSLDKINTTVEGFVFDYNGLTYKFTGNFAPINQILGLFRYGRGNAPPIQEGGEAPAIIQEDEERMVALIPGKFKPPHSGHLQMVRHYAELADQVIVFVSPIEKKLSNGNDVSFDDSIKVWDIYVKDAGLNNVKVMKSPKNSPVSATFDFVANQDNNPEWAQPGDRIILGASTKGGDECRFAGDVQKYAREGVEVLNPMEYMCIPDDDDMHGTDFRTALERGQDITEFLPEESQNEESIRTILNILNSNVEKKTLTMESLYSLVDKLLLEVQPQTSRDIAKVYKSLSAASNKRKAAIQKVADARNKSAAIKGVHDQLAKSQGELADAKKAVASVDNAEAKKGEAIQAVATGQKKIGDVSKTAAKVADQKKKSFDTMKKAQAELAKVVDAEKKLADQRGKAAQELQKSQEDLAKISDEAAGLVDKKAELEQTVAVAHEKSVELYNKAQAAQEEAGKAQEELASAQEEVASSEEEFEGLYDEYSKLKDQAAKETEEKTKEDEKTSAEQPAEPKDPAEEPVSPEDPEAEKEKEEQEEEDEERDEKLADLEAAQSDLKSQAAEKEEAPPSEDPTEPKGEITENKSIYNLLYKLVKKAMENDRSSTKKNNFNLVEDNPVATELHMEELEEDDDEVVEVSTAVGLAGSPGAGKNKKRKSKTLIREED